ncbi:hypothetical protein HZS_3489 [Henneguya salminicola]|nr:hypothetical protein HZS_3489 [Henneguya salminicola]
MRYYTQTFINASFKFVQYPFPYCLIVMIHGSVTNDCVPCAFSLLTYTKKVLINANKHEFTENILVLCYFYLKQAIFQGLI